ncbi:aminotransferase class V-fold PLP-dependent enzyme, partial [Escherichia coli]|nr:aminotransferase class V-fold PLP-dependent enzyme [Escherichia coli]
AETNAYFHVDAVQAIGHLDVKFDEFEIDAMSITVHNFRRPKGVGALLDKEHVTLDYPQLGGEQELKRRAGTENLAQIVGMAKALQLAEKNRDDNNIHLMNLKEQFL